LEKNFLEQIFGIGLRSQHAQRQGINYRRVAIVELAEGVAILRRDSLD
jgi:hypothetical protein